MTRQLLGAAASQLGIIRDGHSKLGDNLPLQYGSSWYLSRKEIENSPSRKDGIDLRKESEIRITYSTFIKDIGIRFKLPQVTIATAIIFCHRFYLHQSHARNDWQTMATSCIFLASKVEYTPISLEKVVKVAYEMIYKKDPATARKIYQKDYFEKQKELILTGERVLLSTVRFGFDIQHPYTPLLLALKKFGMTGKEVRQVAWNFVNDSLHTTLCLQYKPHYIAAASLRLTAKLHNIKLPLEQGYSWWYEFDVTPSQLNAAIQEMTELLGLKRTPDVACEPKKSTQDPLVAKKEASNSPDSCVLSRPNSPKSSSSQCSGRDGGRQRPAESIIPRTTRKKSPTVELASLAVKTELQFQATDSATIDCAGEFGMGTLPKTELTEDAVCCQGSGEGLEQANTEPEQVASNVVSQESGEFIDQTWMKPESIADAGECGVETSSTTEQNEDTLCGQGSGEGLKLANTEPEQVTSNMASQESGDFIDHPWLKSERIADAGEHVPETLMTMEQIEDTGCCQGPGEGLEQANTVPEQVPSNADFQGSSEGADQVRTPEQVAETEGFQGLTPEQIANITSCPGPGEGADQARTPEQFARGEGCQVSDEGMDQSRMTPERIADVGCCHGNGEGCQQCGDFADIVLKSELQVRSSCLEQLTVADLPSIKPENVEAIEDCQGLSEVSDQMKTKAEKVADRLDIDRIKAEKVADRLDIDRIKALRRRKKRETESPSFVEDFQRYSEATEQTSTKLKNITDTLLRKDMDGVEKPANATNGLCKIDVNRIQALRKRRKRELEANVRKEDMNDSEDAWIEKALETGIEPRVSSTLKRQKLC